MGCHFIVVDRISNRVASWGFRGSRGEFEELIQFLCNLTYFTRSRVYVPDRKGGGFLLVSTLKVQKLSSGLRKVILWKGVFEQIYSTRYTTNNARDRVRNVSCLKMVNWGLKAVFWSFCHGRCFSSVLETNHKLHCEMRPHWFRRIIRFSYPIYRLIYVYC